jgi:hypothetical protein
MQFNKYPQWKLSVSALLITLGIFGVVIFISRYATDQKIKTIQTAQDMIALDIASSETQFSLLSEMSCKNVGASSLSSELRSMEARISYAEANKLTSKEELLRLKKSYFLLEIKDFLLLRKINERCGQTTVPVIYVYTTDCSDCIKQGYVLTALQEKYPKIRVYSFDNTVQLSALQALLSVYSIKGADFPKVVIGEKTYTGLMTLEEMETKIPSVMKLAAEQKAAALSAKKASTTPQIAQ